MRRRRRIGLSILKAQSLSPAWIIFEELIQFAGLDPMKNFEAYVSALPRELTVADFAQHDVVTALNSIHFSCFRVYIQQGGETHSDATR